MPTERKQTMADCAFINHTDQWCCWGVDEDSGYPILGACVWVTGIIFISISVTTNHHLLFLVVAGRVLLGGCHGSVVVVVAGCCEARSSGQGLFCGWYHWKFVTLTMPCHIVYLWSPRPRPDSITAWNGLVVWCGVVWCGVVWCGVRACGTGLLCSWLPAKGQPLPSHCLLWWTACVDCVCASCENSPTVFHYCLPLMPQVWSAKKLSLQ